MDSASLLQRASSANVKRVSSHRLTWCSTPINNQKFWVSGYSGKTCSGLADLCTASSCSGRGRCSPIWNATLCACDQVGSAGTLGLREVNNSWFQRWKGATCGAMVDECTSIPCENDGVCESTESGFRCHCRKYYLGMWRGSRARINDLSDTTFKNYPVWRENCVRIGEIEFVGAWKSSLNEFTGKFFVEEFV